MYIYMYIGLSKAFDTLTFDILLYKLKYYRVTGTALNLMSSYLKIENSMLFMILYDLNIPKYTLVYHRGQNWAPCSVYINDLIAARDKLNFLMYAGDTTIVYIST